MARAIWKNTVLADSQETVVVEGNHYFHRKSVRSEHLHPSSTRTTCSWKGEASYYDVEVGGEINKDAAWYYPHPKPAAEQITDYVAFWRGVEVTD